MKIARILLTGLLFLGILVTGYSQKKLSLEKVTMEEMQMTSYPEDSTADAVILMDIGRLDGNNLTFTRKRRIKILKKSGMDWGNQRFNTPTKGDFKVVTYNLVDGEIQTEKANSKSIHEEKIVDDFEIYKVFAPNVRVGSVIDITYSHLGPPLEWRFQERIPIVANELILEHTDYIRFSKTHFGFQPIETISPYQWRCQKMPAFHPEPFMSTYENYITKFEIQIESIGRPGYNYFEYSTTWKAVANNLLRAWSFWGIDSPVLLNDFAKKTKGSTLTTKEKIQAAYDYIQANMKWDGNSALYCSRDFRERFQNTHTGTSADINLLLVALLNKMDITTYPVALSTRSNGMVVPFSAAISKLNYVVSYVQHEDIEMFIDATLTNVATPGILPARCLNGNGLLVKKDNEQWLELNKSFNSAKRQYVNITMDPSGPVTAKVFNDYVGYGFLDWADKVKANNNDAEIMKNSVQKENPDLTITKYEVSKIDPKTVAGKETIELDMTNQLIDAGGEFIFNPFVMFEYQQNPFKSEDRKYPVDLNYPRDFSSTISVAIPKGFSVKSMPESIKFNNPDGSASFVYMASSTASAMQFRVVLKINKHIFTESEYKDLRLFFSEVVKKLNTPIELSKT